mgnify:FL=1
MGVIEDNGSSAELILENGTIQNHKIRGALSASIRVTEGASFTMNGGTIQDNIANTASSDSSSPAVLLLGASTFTMNGAPSATTAANVEQLFTLRLPTMLQKPVLR